jgi:hypothetical protein
VKPLLDRHSTLRKIHEELRFFEFYLIDIRVLLYQALCYKPFHLATIFESVATSLETGNNPFEPDHVHKQDVAKGLYL